MSLVEALAVVLFDSSKHRGGFNSPWIICGPRLRELWSTTKTYRTIAQELTEEFGIPITMHGVRTYGRTHGLPERIQVTRPPLPKPERITNATGVWMTWLPQHDEALRKKRAEGKSASVIAAELNQEFGIRVTRNAVIGRSHRIGIVCPITRTQAPRRPAAARRPRLLKHLAAATVAPEPIADLQIPVEQRKSFLGLGPHHCRWPVGDVGDPDFFFCGGQAQADNPYCGGHSRMAYRPTRTRAA